MQPWRTGGSFSFGGFWESIKAAALLVFSLGLLSLLAAQSVGLVSALVMLVTLAHLPAGAVTVLSALLKLVVGLVPVVATYTYIDWRWGWKGDNIGAELKPAAFGWLLLGVLGGAVAAGLSWALGPILSGASPSWVVPHLGLVPWSSLVWALLLSLGVEITFRGAVISRFQADVGQREIMIGAVLAPFAWYLIQQILGPFVGAYPWTGVGVAAGFPDITVGLGTFWPALMSVALSLLFLRTDSVWLSAGIRFGMMAVFLVLGGRAAGIADNGAVVVWGVIAAALLLLEWSGQRRMPRRVQGNRGPRVFSRGRTVRGPWGPH